MVRRHVFPYRLSSDDGIRSFSPKTLKFSGEVKSMEASKSQCPKCTGLMERGFVMDRSLTGDRLLRWVEGEPERGGATGVKLIERKTSQITRTDKCDKCGYLEFYSSGEVQYV